MEKIELDSIPKWLHTSELYRNFTEDEDKEVNVKNNRTFELKKIETFFDFKDILKTAEYWGMEFPDELIDFAIYNQDEVLEYLYSKNFPSYRFLIQKILYDYSFDIGYNDLRDISDGNYEMKIFVEGYRGKNLIYSMVKKITFKPKKIKNWIKFNITNFHVEAEKNKILFNITEFKNISEAEINSYSFYIPRNKYNKENFKNKLKEFVNKFNKDIDQFQ